VASASAFGVKADTDTDVCYRRWKKKEAPFREPLLPSWPILSALELCQLVAYLIVVVN